MKKLALITGTRADWGLLSRLARALDARHDCELVVVATNMHLLPQYGDTIKEIEADGFKPVRVPIPHPAGVDKAVATGETTVAMAKALGEIRPDKVVILGDRFEMLGAATAALMLRIPIVHIAGGETSEGAIDDSIRHAITQMSSLHLTSTEPYRQRVIAMGADPAAVVNTGAIGVDDIDTLTPMSRSELAESLGFDITPDTLLVTYHPATRDEVDVRVRFGQVIEALDRFPNPVLVTYPNNDARGQEIIDMISEWAARRPQLHVVPSLGHKRYLSALHHVAAVVGNSSSGIVEVPSAGIPTVDIGMRQRGRIAADSVIHCGDSADEIAAAVTQALRRGRRQTDNPYRQPDTLAKMVTAIMGDSKPAAETQEQVEECAPKPLFIIPARGGSKGIPHKNIKPLNGRPLIHYAIDTAMALAEDGAHVVVSTDDPAIARVALDWPGEGKVSVRNRPPGLATDTAGSREVMLDAMDWAEAQGVDYNCVVLLQPTSPFRNVDDVKACLDFYNPGLDMVVTVADAAANPYYDCFETDTEGLLRIAKGEGLYTRRQQAPRCYQLNGAVYVINPTSLRRMPMGKFPRRLPSVMPTSRSLDLDTPQDWAVAEALLSHPNP